MSVSNDLFSCGRKIKDIKKESNILNKYKNKKFIC